LPSRAFDGMKKTSLRERIEAERVGDGEAEVDRRFVLRLREDRRLAEVDHLLIPLAPRRVGEVEAAPWSFS
jgi:hypothetical protein